MALGFLMFGQRSITSRAPAAEGTDPLPPKWVRFRLERLAAGLDVEAESQEWRGGFSTTPMTRDRLYIAPAVELGGHGSIYHPNLFEYDLQGEGLISYEQFDLAGSPNAESNGHDSSWDPLIRYNLNARLLKDKPYSPSFHASRGRAFRDLDFFTRTTVDTEDYGAVAGYRTGLIPFNVSYDRRSESESGMARPSSTDEEIVAVDARNSRAYGGETQFTYSHNNFNRLNRGFAEDSGDSHRADLTDTEKLGADDWILLRSLLRYGRVDSTGRNDEDLQFSENLTLRHSSSLQSYYDYSYSSRASGGTDNIGNTGGAGIQHQLFESLTSSLEFRGEDQSSTGPSGTVDILRYGGTLAENYTKKLGDWGRLHLGYSLGVQPEERTFSGTDINILDEPHTLRDSDITLLALPNADVASIRITDTTGTILYLANLDYLVFSRGAVTEIRRVSGGHIPNGGAVLVSYVARNQESDRYTNIINAFQWRLDLFGRLLSFYARVTIDQKPGGKSATLNEFVDTVAGVESEWKGLQLGAEYENYDSTLTPYTAFRFREGYNWSPLTYANFGINFSQTFTEFPDTNRRVDYQDVIARVEIRPVRSVSIKLEGGYRIEEGDGVDQTIFTARADVSYTLGRFAAALGYEYHDESYFADLYHKHFLYLKVRRTF
ncbi:MAG: hypothetical protein IT581_22635 [Verrucomicrobiales bacterium]|nr:hypothetical protein [Verrucomicrobiales bacterium]